MSEKYKDCKIYYDNEYRIVHRNDCHPSVEIKPGHHQSGSKNEDDHFRLKKRYCKKKKKSKKIYIYKFW